MNVKRLFRAVAPLFLMLPLVVPAGCRSSDSRIGKEPLTLRIGYSSAQDFERRYADRLSREFPEWTIEIVPSGGLLSGREPDPAGWLRKHPVDLIYLPPASFRKAADRGLLLDLEPRLEADPELEASFRPNLLELSALYGNGPTGGLIPSFYGEAVAVNRRTFEENGIRVPDRFDGWTDLVMLARRFDRGLLTPYEGPFDWIRGMGGSIGLSLRDEEDGSYELDTPAWRRLWRLAARGLLSGSVRVGGEGDFSSFVNGEYAMAIVGFKELEQLKSADGELDWTVLPLPSDFRSPGRSSRIVPDGFLSIPRSSAQPDAAWEALTFLLEDEADRRAEEDRADAAFGFPSLRAASALGTDRVSRIVEAVADRPPLPPVDEKPLPVSLREEADKAFRLAVERSIPVEAALRNLQAEADEGKFPPE
ncbi:extracellular solute-binding protein [Cohnella xylanilytica]|uniref:Extracellular solute-binding protein n=1 Tax=Cohnella xylanilytica TaxID=557555 RepID=A0A841U925_9BACL|nr:extracellular solute-binding protein [Cohnella xylanilytica]MBB6694604.1 extracellular solute-binding protein [Cohnella xylanilytica]